MRSEDYTDDAICQAMGLTAFVPAGDEGLKDREVLRLLFKPSFHPEAAVTFVRDSASARLSIVALRTQLWRESLPCRLPENAEELTLPPDSLDNLFALANKEANAAPREPRGYGIDGMGISVVYKHGSTPAVFTEWASGDRGHDVLAAQTVWIAWNATGDSSLKNALAEVAIYLGEEYPRLTVPPAAPVTRLLILGSPEERQEYFARLRRDGNDGG